MVPTFYIYADGSDLHEIAPSLLTRIEDFVASYGRRVRVVDQREEKEEGASDLPAWDLGVNFESDALTNVEKKDLSLFFQALSAEFGRDFVVGGLLPNGQTEDFASLSAGESLDPALDLLLAHEERG